MCSQHIAGCYCRGAGLGFPAFQRVGPNGRARVAFTWYWKARTLPYLRRQQPFSHRDSVNIATMEASRCLCSFTEPSCTGIKPLSCDISYSMLVMRNQRWRDGTHHILVICVYIHMDAVRMCSVRLCPTMRQGKGDTLFAVITSQCCHQK